MLCHEQLSQFSEVRRTASGELNQQFERRVSSVIGFAFWRSIWSMPIDCRDVKQTAVKNFFDQAAAKNRGRVVC